MILVRLVELIYVANFLINEVGFQVLIFLVKFFYSFVFMVMSKIIKVRFIYVISKFG